MYDADKNIEWKARFEAWEASGLSVSEWCRQQDIKKHQMYYWVRKFREEEDSNQEPATKWLTVNVQDIPSHSTDQESVLVHFGSMSVEVRPGTNMELLSNVVRVLQNQ